MSYVKVQSPTKTRFINKLFLIGNGFDLALGLKTSYNDFLLWILKENIIKAINSGGKQFAPFPKYKGRYDEFLRENTQRTVYGYSTNNIFDILLSKSYHLDKSKLEKTSDLYNLFDFCKTYGVEIVTENKEGIFSNILNDSSFGWVDIEGIYFKFIKEILNENNKRIPLEYIDILNDEFEMIIFELKRYLKTINTDIAKDNAILHLNHFDNPITEKEILESDNSKIKTNLNYFLNFNYTDSLKNVLKYSKIKNTVNHIHGELSNLNGSIVFGFGDEMDSIYRELEELNDNRFFKYIKSFQYFKSENYRELLRFLNANEYQVCIYGHSCGLSDRIMLNEIFEHENCKSIKIYFYQNDLGETDFTNKTMEISRHFNSNKIMRTKIVNENSLNTIPQVSI